MRDVPLTQLSDEELETIAPADTLVDALRDASVHLAQLALRDIELPSSPA